MKQYFAIRHKTENWAITPKQNGFHPNNWGGAGFTQQPAFGASIKHGSFTPHRNIATYWRHDFEALALGRNKRAAEEQLASLRTECSRADILMHTAKPNERHILHSVESLVTRAERSRDKLIASLQAESVHEVMDWFSASAVGDSFAAQFATNFLVRVESEASGDAQMSPLEYWARQQLKGITGVLLNGSEFVKSCTNSYANLSARDKRRGARTFYETLTRIVHTFDDAAQARQKMAEADTAFVGAYGEPAKAPA